MQGNIPDYDAFSDVTLLDANTGVAVSGLGIYKTTNGGATWAWVNVTLELDSVSFADANTGVAVGAGARIVRTTDGGETWTTVSTDAANNWLFDVSFGDSSTGAAVGVDGTILRETDGGDRCAGVVCGEFHTLSRGL